MNAEVVYSLPDAAQVGSLLGMLFENLAVKPGVNLDLSDGVSNWAGVYVNDADLPVAVCACDIAFAAGGGAALSMLPPAIALEAIKGKMLTPVMIANLREVLNICTRLLIKDNLPHLRLGSVSKIGDLPGEAAKFLSGSKRRVDFAITLAKYGSGTLTLALA